MTHARFLLPVAATLLLSACAGVPADRGMGDVRTMLDGRGAPLPDGAAHADIATLPAGPLTPDRAVAIALTRNPELRAEYARLGLAQADVLEAGRLGNPELSLSALDSNAAGESMQLGYALVQNFTDLLLLRARSDLAGSRLAQEKARVAERIRSLALAVKGAAIDAIGAQQVVKMRDLIAASARASAELAGRFLAAGNINELEYTREQAAATEAALAADAARARNESARWRLHRLMGLDAGEQQWQLHDGLSQPPAEEDPLAALQALALEQRLDLLARRGAAQESLAAADLVRRWRWLPFLAVGVEGEREGDGTDLAGLAVSLQLPLFNQGQDRLLRAEAMAELAAAGVTQLELDIAMEVAVAHGRMAAARARALRHVQELIPQRETIVARMREMQNYMLVGQFELILARQQEFDAYQSYLEAVRDYWLARAELEHAVGAPLPGDAHIDAAKVTVPVLPEPDADTANESHRH